MQEFPDGNLAKSAAKKWGFKRSLGIFAKYLKYFSVAILVIVIIGYNYVMRPGFLQPLIIEQFAKQTNGTIEITVEQASLFRGFKFANIVVHPPQGYTEVPIFKAREVNLLYNVYGFFRGKFGVHEIALRDAAVFIEQKNDIFSVQALMKPSEKTPEKKKKEEEVEKKGSSVISWFFDVQIFARFVLQNFNFTLDAMDKSNKQRQYAHLKNFTFGFSVLTRNFNKINTANPADMVALLNALVIELNPQKEIDISYLGKAATVRSKLDLFWLLFYDGQSKKPEFLSRMAIGQENFPVALSGRAPQNLSFLASHKIEYNAKEDRLKIQDFNVKFLGDTVLSLSGGGEKLLEEKRTFDIQTDASRLNLGRVYEVISLLTGKRDPFYSGFFSIKPTMVKIRGTTIEDKGGIKLQGVQVRAGKNNISIPSFDFDHEAFVDSTIKPIPVRHAQAKLRSVLNGAAMGLDASLAEDKRVAVSFYLNGFDVTPFAKRQAIGRISTNFSAKGPTLHDLALNLRVFSPQLQYFIDRGKSGINRIDFNVRGSVNSSEDFKQINVNLPTLSFSDKDKENGTAIDLESKVSVEKGQDIKVKYSLDELTIGFKELLNTLPESLQESIGNALASAGLGRTLRADGETTISVAGKDIAIEHSTQLAIPDRNIDDIVIKAKARLSPPNTYLDEFTLTGLQEALLISADGSLKQVFITEKDAQTGKKQRVATTQPDIRFKVEIGKKEETEVMDDSFLVGLFSLTGTAKGDVVDGHIKISDLSFRNPQVKANKVNMSFPFKHDLKLKKTLNLRAGNKERIIKNYNFNKPYNFSIDSIEIPDPRNSKNWLKLLYSRGSYPAIGAHMEYKDNVFLMPVLQMYMLNGVVTISDTLFNLGRLKTSEMEYTTTIQIKDIDLKQIMVKDKAESITDGKLRIDMLFTGNRLDKPIENLNGYLSVFRIGPEFAQMVMRAASPKQSNLISSVASNAVTPRKIDIDLKDGFVYSDIPLDKGFVGYMVPTPEEIKNRRINIPEFFQRIASEASGYAAPAAENTGG